MKFRRGSIIYRGGTSRPARDAWVEIAWILERFFARQSRPARDAWVEIIVFLRNLIDKLVASRKGRVG